MPNSQAQQFEALFKYASIGMIVTDAQGVILNFNDNACEQFGYAPEEIIGTSVDKLLPNKARNAHAHLREGFYAHPAPRRMGEGRDLFAVKKDGTEFPVEVSLSYYHIGGELYVIAFVIDITVRKRSEEVVLRQKTDLERMTTEMMELNAQLEQKVDDRTKMLREALGELEKSQQGLSEALEAEKELGELKSRFVTMASHEFRTPLSTILSSAYLLGRYPAGEAGEKRDKHLLNIKSAVAEMKSILEDFLSLEKLEEGKTVSQQSAIEAGVFLDELRNTLGELEVLLKPDQRVAFDPLIKEGVIKVDMHLLKNILMNLVSNAIKFSAEGTLITIGLSRDPGILVLTVRDEGIGISEEDRHHLFERFFRGRNTSGVQGTGLGLHIVRRYLDLLGGDIQVQSALNQGTQFTIRIPQLS